MPSQMYKMYIRKRLAKATFNFPKMHCITIEHPEGNNLFTVCVCFYSQIARNVSCLSATSAHQTKTMYKILHEAFMQLPDFVYDSIWMKLAGVEHEMRILHTMCTQFSNRNLIQFLVLTLCAVCVCDPDTPFIHWILKVNNAITTDMCHI